MNNNIKVAALAVAGVVGVLLLFGASRSNASKPESVTIQNHTVSGNILEDLKADNQNNITTTNKSVTRHDVDTSRVVYFNNQVHSGSVQAAVTQLKALEAKSSEPIWLLINSPGGDVIHGTTLINQMEASKAPVYTVCTKLCASMAAMFHSYGAKRYALDRAFLMYHPASGGLQGQLPNMLSVLKTLTRYINKMNANVVKRSKLDKTEYESLVAYEIWIDSEDALEKGLIDGIVSLNVGTEPENAPSEQFVPEEMSPPQYQTDVKFQMISPYLDLWTK